MNIRKVLRFDAILLGCYFLGLFMGSLPDAPPLVSLIIGVGIGFVALRLSE